MKGSRATGKASAKASTLADLRRWQSQIIEDTTAVLRPQPHLAPEVRDVLQGLAHECQTLLFDDLAKRASDDWYVIALAGVTSAAEHLRWFLSEPFFVGEIATLINAARLLGRANVVIGQKRSADRHRTGRPRGSAPTRQRIEGALQSSPNASAYELASSTHASDRYVRKVRRAVKK